jgi:hypothetical protein
MHGRRRKEEQGIQEFDDPKQMMIKILSAIIINHVQSLVNGTLSSVPDSSSSSSNPILSSLTFSNQTDQNDRYNIKQGLSEEIHEIHKGDISD